MPQVSQALLQTWTHSFEEDEGTVHVYHPASYPFPRQRRPRDGIEFRPNGTFTLLKPGAADKRERLEGTWSAENPARLRLSGIGGESFVEILHVDSALLKIRGLP